jgi:hypothetical protein
LEGKEVSDREDERIDLSEKISGVVGGRKEDVKH